MATALIFDCDGVLIDSEPLSVAELGASLREAGAEITDNEIFVRMVGLSIAKILDIVRREYGVDAAPYIEDFRLRLEQRFAASLQPIEGIADALDALADLPRAVASSSTPSRLEQTLTLTNLKPRLAPHIYSASLVKNGKPAPDLFLYAAEKIGAAPQDCIVIEDSAHGVEAAHAAGMQVIGFTGGGHAEAARLGARLPQLHPDALVAHAAELPETIRKLIAAR
ncbi:HAD family hydrolase [Paracoccaceae bacterium GXU_MW_L88]